MADGQTEDPLDAFLSRVARRPAIYLYEVFLQTAPKQCGTEDPMPSLQHHGIRAGVVLPWPQVNQGSFLSSAASLSHMCICCALARLASVKVGMHPPACAVGAALIGWLPLSNRGETIREIRNGGPSILMINVSGLTAAKILGATVLAVKGGGV